MTGRARQKARNIIQSVRTRDPAPSSTFDHYLDGSRSGAGPTQRAAISLRSFIVAVLGGWSLTCVMWAIVLSGETAMLDLATGFLILSMTVTAIPWFVPCYRVEFIWADRIADADHPVRCIWVVVADQQLVQVVASFRYRDRPGPCRLALSNGRVAAYEPADLVNVARPLDPYRRWRRSRSHSQQWTDIEPAVTAIVGWLWRSGAYSGATVELAELHEAMVSEWTTTLADAIEVAGLMGLVNIMKRRDPSTISLHDAGTIFAAAHDPESALKADRDMRQLMSVQFNNTTIGRDATVLHGDISNSNVAASTGDAGFVAAGSGHSDDDTAALLCQLLQMMSSPAFSDEVPGDDREYADEVIETLEGATDRDDKTTARVVVRGVLDHFGHILMKVGDQTLVDALRSFVSSRLPH